MRNYSCCIHIPLGRAATGSPPRRLSRGPGRREFSLAMGCYEAHGLLAGARVSGVDAAHGACNGKTPLELGTTGVTLHQPGQLGQAYDLPVWYVAHVGLADHRQEVMFAERIQGYVPDQDHLAMFFLEPNVKVPGWVIGKPGEEERVGFGDAARRTSEAFPVGVFAYGY